MAKIDDIRREVDELKCKLLLKEPEDFSEKDFVRSFFGALLLGLTFTVKGLLIDVSQALDHAHLGLIIIFTLLILTAEIYFIGYSRVKNKSKRKLGQFWFKRVCTFYLVAVLTATLLVFLFGLNKLPGVNNGGVISLIILISMPCAIGAAISDLLNKY